jgi:hypothetical protein
MSSNIFNNDINLLISNLNNKLDKQNESITKRNRKIDFKDFYSFLIQYNLNIFL